MYPRRQSVPRQWRADDIGRFMVFIGSSARSSMSSRSDGQRTFLSESRRVAGVAAHRSHHGLRPPSAVHLTRREAQALSLPGSYFAWLAVILISDSVLAQLVKVWYRRRFGSWL